MDGTSPARPFHLSIIEYLNAAPLNYGFKHGLAYQHVHLQFHVPSACADKLKTGEVDAGIVSSIEYLRIPGLRIVPGLCIASPKRVRSVPWNKTPPSGMSRVGVSTVPFSTSVNMFASVVFFNLP